MQNNPTQAVEEMGVDVVQLLGQREGTMEELIEQRVNKLVRQRFAEQKEQMEARLAQHQADTWAIFQPLTGHFFEVFRFGPPFYRQVNL